MDRAARGKFDRFKPPLGIVEPILTTSSTHIDTLTVPHHGDHAVF
jgi:hypothetical protein